MKTVSVRVWAGTLAVAMIYVGAIDLVEIVLFSPRFEPRSLSLALAFAFVQTVAIVVVVGGLFVRKWLYSRRQRRSILIEREIQEALALHSLGQDELPRLRSLMARLRRDVEQGITAALATLLSERARGSSRPQRRSESLSRTIGDGSSHCSRRRRRATFDDAPSWLRSWSRTRWPSLTPTRSPVRSPRMIRATSPPLWT